MKVVYTSEAIDDLVRLREFIEIRNPGAAKRIAYSLVDGIKKLKRFPHIGIKVSEAPNPEAMRDLILENYTVRYLILDKSINILRVWHQREDEKNGL
ncbi:MAG: type II toxin-antitoxin system RelE/ParE family toxin [Gammaproteobacteria bacterium]|nr:type II toxin-antitoxin system RelE/ParE family toxin [Gammaproteobacteria bacterium]MCF6364112.1 type II toxin-antitoxin system RelE/ParE family toxin [Gammaproteobacteria bacterium]